MLGDMETVEPGLVRGGGEFQPLVELGRERTVFRALQVIEKSNFHTCSLSKYIGA